MVAIEEVDNFIQTTQENAQKALDLSKQLEGRKQELSSLQGELEKLQAKETDLNDKVEGLQEDVGKIEREIASLIHIDVGTNGDQKKRRPRRKKAESGNGHVGPGRGHKQCPNCKEYVGVRAKECPYCNYDFETERMPAEAS